MPVRLVLLLALLSSAFACNAQTTLTIDPPNPRADESVTLTITVMRVCMEFEVQSITRAGQHIDVNYILVPADLCFSAPAPFSTGLVPLGGFAPGDYTITTLGTENGQPLPDGNLAFTVAAAALAPPSLPAADNAALALAVLLLLGVGLAAVSARNRH